ncbi:hypothetical protein [Streptomyces sp. NPDC000405]|uniref:hypothetical protein n=1 Tax=Streptomyces sp. NPDC000405 TaxID=3161033 RepID=UPI00398D2732
MLLPLVQDTSQQPGNMPVQMGIALLTAQREQIGPLGLEYLLHSARHGPHDPHQPQVGVLIKIPDSMLNMLASFGKGGERLKNDGVQQVGEGAGGWDVR